MTSDLYQDTTFGPLNVSNSTSVEECSQYVWPTHTFTNTFTKSNSFAKSNSFTNSNLFIDSDIFSKTNITITFSLLITQTLTFQSFLSNTLIQTLSTYIYTEIIYYDYTIYRYSTYYSFYFNFIPNSGIPFTTEGTGKLSNNIIIGIICGVIIVIFLIIGIIVFLIRKGNSKSQSKIETTNSNMKEISNPFSSSSQDKQIKELQEPASNENDQWIRQCPG